MSHHYKGKTIGAAMTSALTSLLESPSPDAVLNIESHEFNVTIEAHSCDYELDIGRHLWLNRSRWSRLIREYIPRSNMERFIENAGEILRGEARDGATANMMAHDPARYAKKHRWGGCFMGFTFRGDGRKAGMPTITMYSRTSYIGYMGFMDAAMASVMARFIGEESGYEGPIAFRWHLSSMQLHCFKTLPFVFSRPKLYKQLQFDQRAIASGMPAGRLRSMPPTRRNMAKWYGKVLQAWDDHGMDMLEHEKYGPFKRIKRRWMEHEGHSDTPPPPSLTLDQLDFSKAVDNE